MINNLVAIMKKEEEELQNLLNTLEEQYKKILKKDIFAMEAIVEKIQLVNREIAQCEVERRRLIGTESMKNIVNSSNDELLSETYKKINNILNEIILQKDTNELLIKQNLSYTNNLLNIVSPKPGVNVYNSYGSINK